MLVPNKPVELIYAKIAFKFISLTAVHIHGFYIFTVKI